MQTIEIDDGLRIRFPHREAEFSEGVEIGVLAVSLAVSGADFGRTISAGNVEQATVLAEKMGFRAAVCRSGPDGTFLMFRKLTERSRPPLRLVSVREA